MRTVSLLCTALFLAAIVQALPKDRKMTREELAAYEARHHSDSDEEDSVEDCKTVRVRIITSTHKIPLDVCKEHLSPLGIYYKFCEMVLADEDALDRYFPAHGEALHPADCESYLEKFHTVFRWQIGSKAYSLVDESVLEDVDPPLDVGLSGIGVGGVQRGSAVDNFLYPWIVSVHQSETEEGEISGMCTGSLISPGWVITAAHCFDDAPKNRRGQVENPGDYHVAAGRFDLTHTTDAEADLRERETGGSERPDSLIATKSVTVAAVIIHPDYNSRVDGSHDVALVRLTTALINSGPEGVMRDNLEDYAYIFPKIVKYEDFAKIFKRYGRPRVTAAGFGESLVDYGMFTSYDYTDHEPDTDTVVSESTGKLWKTKFDVVPCAARRYSTKHYICCRDLTSRRSAVAHGDSGGPLFQFENRISVLFGSVVSGDRMLFKNTVLGTVIDPDVPQQWMDLSQLVDWFIDNNVEFYEMRVTGDGPTADGEIYAYSNKVLNYLDSNKKPDKLKATYKTLVNWKFMEKHFTTEFINR